MACIVHFFAEIASEYFGDIVLFSHLLPGVNPSVSRAAFQEWLFIDLCVRTHLNVPVNGVVLRVENNTPIISHDCLKSVRHLGEGCKNTSMQPPVEVVIKFR